MKDGLKFFFSIWKLVSPVSGLKMDVNGGEMRKNPTLICAPIMADSVDKMVTLMAKAKASTADLVEIRLDSLKNFNPFEDLNVLIKQGPLPTLFTYRFFFQFSFLTYLLWFDASFNGYFKKKNSFVFWDFPLYPCFNLS